MAHDSADRAVREAATDGASNELAPLPIAGVDKSGDETIVSPD